MGFDIGKFVGGVVKAIPLIVSGIQAVERIKSASGADKKAAVMGAVPGMLASVELLVEKDFADDAAVQDTASKLIDAIVAFDKALALARAARDAAKDIANSN